MRISISQCLAEVPSQAVGYAVTPGECKSLGIRREWGRSPPSPGSAAAEMLGRSLAQTTLLFI